jgi:hypothetical protein
MREGSGGCGVPRRGPAYHPHSEQDKKERDMRRRGLVVAFAVVVLLMVAVPAEAGAWAVHLKAPTHHPHAGKRWRFKVTARKRSGKPLHASARYKYLYNGQVVATRYPAPHADGRGHRHKPWHFYGHYKDVTRWPKRAIGYKITFRVVVKAKHRGRKHTDYRIRVRH